MGECDGNLMERFARAVAAVNTRVLRAELQPCRGGSESVEDRCRQAVPDESRCGWPHAAGQARGRLPECGRCCIASPGRSPRFEVEESDGWTEYSGPGGLYTAGYCLEEPAEKEMFEKLAAALEQEAPAHRLRVAKRFDGHGFVDVEVEGSLDELAKLLRRLRAAGAFDENGVIDISRASAADCQRLAAELEREFGVEVDWSRGDE